MNELISLHQANQIMVFVLIAAPIIGAIWGVTTKQLVRGLIYGCVIGGGNFALWSVYNTITGQLGLDTVKNLVVNIVLFIVIGVVAGLVIRRFDKQADKDAKPAD
jgi:DNA integrity scanning protein DisA with diadenylate cyclase activity